MKFIVKGDTRKRKIREIEEKTPISVAEAEKILMNLLSITEEITFSVNGQFLEKSSILPSCLIELSSGSVDNSSGIIDSIDKIEKRRKIEIQTENERFIRSNKPEILDFIFNSANYFKNLYSDEKNSGFKSDNFSLDISKFTQATLKKLNNPIVILEYIDQKMFETYKNIIDELNNYINSANKLSPSYLEKIIFCVDIMIKLIEIEHTTETLLWSQSCIELLNALMEKRGTKNQLKQLLEFIIIAKKSYSKYLGSIKLIESARKNSILELFKLKKVQMFFDDQFNCLEKVEKLLNRTFISEIPFFISSNFINGNLIIFSMENLFEDQSVKNEENLKVAYFLILLQELFKYSQKNSLQLSDFPELKLFNCLFRVLDSEISIHIKSYLQGQATCFDSPILKNHNYSKDAIILKPRIFEHKKKVIVKHNLKILLINHRGLKTNKPSHNKVNKSLDLSNFIELLIPSSSEFSELFFEQIICKNFDNVLLNLLIYSLKIKGGFSEMVKFDIWQVAKVLYKNMEHKVLNREQFLMKHNFGVPFDFGEAFMASLKTLIERLSDVADSNPNNFTNFNKVWKAFKKKRAEDFYWSFKNPNFKKALISYRSEMLNELFNQRIKTSNQISIDYLFVSDSEIFKVQKKIKTLFDLNLVDIFRAVMQNPAIKQAYSDFQNFNRYDEILESALGSTSVFKLPQTFYGKTLVTKEIILGNFSDFNENLELLNGGLLYEFIHEFCHYLQRFNLSNLKDFDDFNTPPKLTLMKGNFNESGGPNAWKTREAGDEIEEILFQSPKKLYLDGARFLLSLGNRKLDQESICEEFKKENGCHDEFLNLRNLYSGEGESLDLGGVCGLWFRKMTFNHI